MRFIPGIQVLLNIEKQIIVIYFNRLKVKNYIIMPIDSENSLDKIQHQFVIKSLLKLGIEGNNFNMMVEYL